MAEPTVVVARSADGGPEGRAFEDGLVQELTRAGVDVLIVPHVYHLRSDHPAAVRIRSLTGPVVAAAWLFPRATRWILHTLGFDQLEHETPCLDLRAQTGAPDCAREILSLVPSTNGRAGPGSAAEIDDAVDSRWYPVLDYAACVACAQCHNFCLFDVYEIAGDGQVVAAYPDRCKPGCPACARTCPHGAIMFPHFTDPAIAGDPDAPMKPPGPVVCTIEPLAAKPKPTPADTSVDALIDALDEIDDA